MNVHKIRRFRKTLRCFEYLISEQIRTSTTCAGVSMAQCHTLLGLEECMPCSLNKLADMLSLEKSTVSRTIDGLVKTGLVSRKDNPENRRQSELSLTAQGRCVVADINRDNNTFFGGVLAGLPNGRENKVIEAFEQLTDSFERQLWKVRAEK